jgi:Mrp family chromosome partitioning ATPase
MLGVLLALLEEKFGHLLRRRGRRSRRRKAEPALTIPKNWDGPPILGELNNAYSLRAADYVIDWPASRFAKASAALVRQLESRNGEGAVIALTTPDPGEARSVVAVAIARAAAAMDKRVVILDLDPTHRTTAALGANGRAGLYEVLTGSVALNEALVRDPRSGAFLLSLKQRPAQTAAMFASPQMQRLLSILRDGCDLVILDCGQMRRGPDTALLARQADATLLVSPRKRMRARTLARAAENLQRAQAAPLGLVLAG